MNSIKNYDAEFCGRVPLNQTNLVQPHGVLLIVKKDDLTILQASENADAVFGMPAAELVRQRFANLVSATEAAQFRTLFGTNVAGRLPLLFTVQGKRFLGVVEQQESYFIVEMEKETHAEEEKTAFISVYQDVKRVMATIEACATTEETCRVAAIELKQLSGFDKVMVYCFDESWNGDVIAEEMEPGMESYLGLKFPASDIPKQARELYRKTPFRLIPATDYEPVRLYPVINPLTNAFTDLSNSNLRSVASVHLEYLRNMKVTASMSTRILKDGELWGLIACHHRTPMFLSYEMCSVFELLSNVITSKISAMQNRDSFRYKSGKQHLQQKLVEQVLAKGELLAEQSLMELLDADGVAVVTNHRIVQTGKTPAQEEIEDLVYWLQANAVSGVYHQPSLSRVYEAAETYAETSSGLLALPIEMDKGDFVLAFRSEAVQKISWGGNPDDAIQFESDGKKYHPRASFKIWQQTVRQTALPWKKETLEIAESLRNFLVESRLNRKY